MAVANKLAGEPVVLIAVNSGNSRGQVESYARQNRITIPIIVDSDRTLENQLGVGEISLQNIWAAAILNADGRVVRANASDLEAAASQALQGAKWNVDPEGIPADLRPAWQAIEFGNFAAGAPAVSKGLKSGKAEVKEAAEKLNAYAQGLIEEQLDSAQKALADNDKFEAYRLYFAIKSDFKGFELPDDLDQTVRELYLDTTVKKELAAMKRLESAKMALSSPSEATRQKARKLLEALIKTDPDTRAGQEAQAILTELSQ